MRKILFSFMLRPCWCFPTNKEAIEKNFLFKTSAQFSRHCCYILPLFDVY
jgi:hypothetical protein